MLLLAVSSLPNLLTAWYSALNCPSNHSDINANEFENLIKHFMRAHVAQHFYSLCNCRRKRVMASIKKRRIPSFYRLGLLCLFLNSPNIKHVAYIYNRSIAYLAGMKEKNNTGKCILHSLFKCIDDMYFFPLPLF